MNRFIPLGLIAGLVLAAFIGVSPATANAQSAGLVSSVLNRLEKNRASLKSLRAGINMEKYNSQLGTKDTSTGVVLYIPGAGRNASVRLEWKSPQHEVLAVKDGKYVLFRPRLGIAYTGKSSDRNGQKASGIIDMMYMSKQQLEAKFQPLQDVREETLWGGVSTIHLTLVPKGNSSYKYAEVWIDSSGMPVQSKIVERNDDATTMRLVSIEKNPRISPDDIPVKLESNVKVVKS
jgi:outer membrane lipoprotein-sorting protein